MRMRIRRMINHRHPPPRSMARRRKSYDKRQGNFPFFYRSTCRMMSDSESSDDEVDETPGERRGSIINMFKTFRASTVKFNDMNA